MIHTQDADFTLICADVLDGLRSLEAESVHCVVTSPPYWGLRDYGTGLWAGGDEDCDHIKQTPIHEDSTSTLGVPADGGPRRIGAANATVVGKQVYGDVCGKCGATRQDQQLGLEATPDLYVARIVAVFREVRRVLRADGTCWVNLGDSYAGSWGNQGRKEERGEQRPINGPMLQPLDGRYPQQASNTGAVPAGLKPKDLVGIPWRVAFALQADGWYLRSDIIWAKPNPMPESVTDRPTKSHEYVFLLSKQARYFFDQEAVREPNTERWADSHYKYMNGNVDNYSMDAAKRDSPGIHGAINPAGRNVRSVRDIATQPYPEAHFATYPEELVRRCVLAGTSERGCCPVCGKPWEREVERSTIEDVGRSEYAKRFNNQDRNDNKRRLGGRIRLQ